MLKTLQSKFEGKNIEVVATGTITASPLHIHKCSILEEIEGNNKFLDIEDIEGEKYLRIEENKIKNHEATYVGEEILYLQEGQNLIIGIQGSI